MLLSSTRERIRQIKAKALRKMRHPTRIRKLEGVHRAAGGVMRFYQFLAAPSKLNGVSGESSVLPDSMAWTAIKLSKGSSCPSGNVPDR